MKDAKRQSKADSIGDAVLTVDNVDKAQNGCDLEGKERQRAEEAPRREEEEEKLEREEAEFQQREIEEKAKADRQAAEARRQEQERAEQKRVAKAADEEKLDAWMKTKEKGRFEAQVQEPPELARL